MCRKLTGKERRLSLLNGSAEECEYIQVVILK